MTTPSRRRLLAVLPALAVLGLSGCGPEKADPPQPAASSPSPSQISDVARRLETIPGVTHAEVSFDPGHKLIDGPYWNAKITAPKTDKPGLLQILDQAYRTIWLDADVPFGTLNVSVSDGAGISVGRRDWPDGPETPSEMERRYGLRG